MNTSIAIKGLARVCVLFLAIGLAGCNSNGRPGLFSSMGYHVGSTSVWIKSPGSGIELYTIREVVGADPKTFHWKTLTNKLGNGQVVGFDAKSVYWGAERVEGADKDTFEYVGSEYFKDKSYGYHLAERISDDASHFEIFEEFARDAKNVYFGREVFSSDAPNFVRVGDETSRFYKDLTHCWFGIYPIEGADTATIRHIAQDFARDEAHVYHQMNGLENADPDSFQPLQDEFSRDARSVYFASLQIEGAEPESFRVLNERIGVDKSHCFYYGQLLDEADPGSFRVIDEFYTADATHVWVNGLPIVGADPATFQVLDSSAGKSRDAKNEYDMAERVGPTK